jgi:hypothetical protein
MESSIFTHPQPLPRGEFPAIPLLGAAVDSGDKGVGLELLQNNFLRFNAI